MKFVWKTLIGLAIFLTLNFQSAFGQAGTSTIRGTVTDPQGGVVAHAQVSIKNASGFSRSQETTSNGAYSFDLIPVGDYDVTVEAAGFRKASHPSVHALVSNVVTLDVKLEVGSTSQIVQVEAGTSEVQINTQDATLGNTIVANQINQLPLEGRNVLSVLTLQPAVTPDGSVAGARSDQSNITLDGIDINEAQSSDISSAVLRLNAEAVEEFRVTTVNANADEGRSSAAQINLVSKSGSNQWHGSAFEFYRGGLFEANDWFNNTAGVALPHLVRNTFSGGLGGPIVKNKLFFFYNYEGQRDARGVPVARVVPFASLGQGTLNYKYCVDPACATTAIASLNLAQNQQVYSDAGINQAALDALTTASTKYPVNDSSVGDGLNTGGFRFNAPVFTRLNSHFARFDYVVNSKQNVFVRLNYISDHVPTTSYFPDTISPQTWSHPYGIAVGHTWTLTNNLINNFRYGLTREAFTSTGDSTGNDIRFRFVFQPNSQTHDLSRVTPVHNFRDDLSWIHGKHVFQFGTNIRKINNTRVDFSNSFDSAITNPSFYAGAGESVSDTFQQYLDDNGLPGDENVGQALNSISEIQNAGTAIIGRFSEYQANFSFGTDGAFHDIGVPTNRNFATQSYDGYFQDSWKIKPHFTLTAGLRYSLERPIYETQGFEVLPGLLDGSGNCAPDSLGDYFNKRKAAALHGTNYTPTVCTQKSGPANGGKPMYNWDKNNFQPRIAVAWSPNFSKGLFHSIFGDPGKSVIRSGFALTNDYYGQALAVDFDLNNTIGFTANSHINANTFDIFAGSLGPQFTGFNQDVRSLPLMVVPSGGVTFPEIAPGGNSESIESSLDASVHAPTEYAWNLTYERQFRAGTTLTVSYIGRAGRDLLARRDVMAFNDLVDPKSGMDWYTAGTLLEKQRAQGINTSQIASIPYFDNLFPANLVDLFNNDPFIQAGFPSNWTPTQVFYGMMSRTPRNPLAFFGGNDWTDAQAEVDVALLDAGLATKFMQEQWGALSAWSTVGNSNYHGLAVTVRQRLHSLTMDFNYTMSHSTDDASGLQTGGGFGAAFITNPLRQGASYASSDFDIRHLLNAAVIWQLPFGKGRAFMNGGNHFAEAVLGGWQLSGIGRWNTGLPNLNSPFDDARWATNWNVQANVVPTVPIHTCPTRIGTPKPTGTGLAKLFGGSSCDLTTVYQSFRNAYPGETGPRNWLRLPGYANADLGLSKTFSFTEKQQLQLRWEVFNVANHQPFASIDGSRTGIGVARDPARRGLTPPANWSNFDTIQGSPRVMQIGLRYSF
ncbi:MAG TPA: TonB-dependent receptor [Candidatus Acidoferrum sp.]|nr:TonB-dependent receptor [Candidatus Acidoferrum sp.]